MFSHNIGGKGCVVSHPGRRDELTQPLPPILWGKRYGITLNGIFDIRWVHLRNKLTTNRLENRETYQKQGIISAAILKSRKDGKLFFPARGNESRRETARSERLHQNQSVRPPPFWPRRVLQQRGGRIVQPDHNLSISQPPRHQCVHRFDRHRREVRHSEVIALWAVELSGGAICLPHILLVQGWSQRRVLGCVIPPPGFLWRPRRIHATYRLIHVSFEF